jgi:hypothetical protein
VLLVPPLAIGKTPVTPVVKDKLVALARLAEAKLLIVALVRVRLPTLVVVPPRVIVALPSVAVLLAKNELGNVVPTLDTVTLVNVKLPTDVVVFPKYIAVLPSVRAVAKFESNCDNGIDVVAVAKVYGTDIKTSLSFHAQIPCR